MYRLQVSQHGLQADHERADQHARKKSEHSSAGALHALALFAKPPRERELQRDGASAIVDVAGVADVLKLAFHRQPSGVAPELVYQRLCCA